MQAVAYSAFRRNLKMYMRQVNQDADELLITNTDPDDNVVVMGARDYESLLETLRIYQNQPLFQKIRKGMEEVGADEAEKHELTDPVMGSEGQSS